MFRAWDEGNKVMHYDFEYISSGNEADDWIVFTSDKQTLKCKMHPLNNPYFKRQFHIQKSTGIRYKDTFIYEDDILKSIYFLQVFRVFYSNTLGRWMVTDDINRPLELYPFSESSTVIGNLHETPEIYKQLCFNLDENNLPYQKFLSKYRS